MKWELFFSWRMIRSHKGRSLVSPMSVTAVLSIAFGITAMLVSVSVISGFQEAYKRAILGFNSHLVILGERDISDVKEIAKKILSFRPTLTAVTPFIFREGLGIVKDGVSNIVLKGVEPETMENVYHVHFQSLVPEQNLSKILSDNSNPLPTVIVGKDLLKKFFPETLPENPVIRLLIPKEEKNSSRDKNHSLSDFAQRFRVVGFFDSGLYEFDSQFILTSIESMQSIFHLSGAVTGFEAVLDDPDKAPQMARVIEAALDDSNDNLLQVISWDELNEALFSAMKMEKTLFLVMMLLIMMIASFNVVGIMMMMILNRGRDIAILKAMGVPVRVMMRVFSIQGLYLALIGTALGSLLSFILLYSLQRFSWLKLDPEIYFISQVPVVWPKMLWMILIGVSLAICYGTSMIATRISLREGTFHQTFR